MEQHGTAWNSFPILDLKLMKSSSSTHEVSHLRSSSRRMDAYLAAQREVGRATQRVGDLDSENGNGPPIGAGQAEM